MLVSFIISCSHARYKGRIYYKKYMHCILLHYVCMSHRPKKEMKEKADHASEAIKLSKPSKIYRSVHVGGIELEKK